MFLLAEGSKDDKTFLIFGSGLAQRWLPLFYMARLTKRGDAGSIRVVDFFCVGT
jgi:hypothetical protein